MDPKLGTAQWSARACGRLSCKPMTECETCPPEPLATFRATDDRKKHMVEARSLHSHEVNHRVALSRTKHHR